MTLPAWAVRQILVRKFLSSEKMETDYCHILYFKNVFALLLSDLLWSFYFLFMTVTTESALLSSNAFNQISYWVSLSCIFSSFFDEWTISVRLCSSSEFAHMIQVYLYQFMYTVHIYICVCTSQRYFIYIRCVLTIRPACYLASNPSCSFDDTLSTPVLQ